MENEKSNDQEKDAVNYVFTLLAQIAANMDNQPDKNGCVITKINLQEKAIESRNFGVLIFDSEGYQFARFLRNATEKATRMYYKEIPHVSGGVNLQVINLECSISDHTYNVYGCSGFEQKYNEGIVLIGGLFEDVYTQKPGRPTEDYLAEIELLIVRIIEGVDKLSLNSVTTLNEMFRLLRKKLEKQNVLI